MCVLYDRPGGKTGRVFKVRIWLMCSAVVVQCVKCVEVRCGEFEKDVSKKCESLRASSRRHIG